MKSAIAAMLGVLISQIALGADCGRALTLPQLEAVAEPLYKANETVLQHLEGIATELGGLLDSQVQYQKATLEFDHLRMAHDQGSRLESQVDTIRVLLQIRDTMRDQTDRAVVSRHVIRRVQAARTSSERGTQRINTVLTRLGRPGIAIDVSKMRDSITQVGELFGKCN